MLRMVSFQIPDKDHCFDAAAASWCTIILRCQIKHEAATTACNIVTRRQMTFCDNSNNHFDEYKRQSDG
jgi:hypothetical protein